MDVEAEDDLLLGHPALALEDLLVAVPGGYGLLAPVRERVGARSGDADALLFCGPSHPLPQPQQLRAHLRERAADGGQDLELRRAELGHDPILSQSLLRAAQHVPCPRAEGARLGVYDLVFLLDPEGVIARLCRHPNPLLRDTERYHACRVAARKNRALKRAHRTVSLVTIVGKGSN